MDNNTLSTAGLATTFTVIAGILYKIYMAINHKRIRSNCCGKKLEASLDIENTTPPHEHQNDQVVEPVQPVQSLQIQSQRKLQVQIPPLQLDELNRNVIKNPMRV